MSWLGLVLLEGRLLTFFLHFFIWFDVQVETADGVSFKLLCAFFRKRVICTISDIWKRSSFAKEKYKQRHGLSKPPQLVSMLFRGLEDALGGRNSHSEILCGCSHHCIPVSQSSLVTTWWFKKLTLFDPIAAKRCFVCVNLQYDTVVLAVCMQRMYDCAQALCWFVRCCSKLFQPWERVLCCVSVCGTVTIINKSATWAGMTLVIPFPFVPFSFWTYNQSENQGEKKTTMKDDPQASCMWTIHNP